MSEKIKIKLLFVSDENSFGNNGWGGFNGTLIGYKPDGGGPSGTFSTTLLSTYEKLFEIENRDYYNNNTNTIESYE